MPSPPGTKFSPQVLSAIKPVNNGPFHVVEDIDVAGGYQVRADNTDRDAIPAVSRKEGMLVYVQDPPGTYYTLSGGITNSDWTVVTLGGGGGGTPTTVIYKQGVMGPVAPIYGTFAEAYNAVAGIPGAVIIIDSVDAGSTTYQYDDSTMGVGTYDLTGLTLRGTTQTGFLYVVTGTVITHLPDLIDNLFWISTSTTPVYTTNGTGAMSVTNSGLSTTGTGTDFITVTNFNYLNIRLVHDSYFGVDDEGSTGNEVIKLTNTAGGCSIVLGDSCYVPNGSTTAPGGGVHVDFYYTSTSATLPPKAIAEGNTHRKFTQLQSLLAFQLSLSGGVSSPQTLSRGFDSVSSISTSVRTRSDSATGADRTVFYDALDDGTDRTYDPDRSFTIRAYKLDGTVNTSDNSIVDVIVIFG